MQGGELLLLNRALLAAYRGETDDAVEEVMALQKNPNPVMGAWRERIRSVAATCGGDPATGYGAAMAAIALQPSGMNSPVAVWAAGHAALWARSDPVLAIARLRATIDETSMLRGEWIGNVRRSLEAAIAALDGRTEEAGAIYAEALKSWRTLQLPFDHAMTVVDALSVHDETILPDGAVDDARAFLQRIGAQPALARLDRAAADAPTPSHA